MFPTNFPSFAKKKQETKDEPSPEPKTKTYSDPEGRFILEYPAELVPQPKANRFESAEVTFISYTQYYD